MAGIANTGGARAFRTFRCLTRAAFACVASNESGNGTPPPNFTLKLVRPGFGPAAELPTF